jgi:predicted O-methyltransferase YrrM
MEFAAIAARVGHVPFIERQHAERLYNLIVSEKRRRILELGIAHGTATCYMAAALEEIGGGLITAVDLIEAADYFIPRPEEQLTETGLGRFAEIIRTKTGYNWFLHDNILRNTADDICREEYDLCVIDGAKNWTSEGAAFFFVDKLLKPGGWIIFDDYLWSAAWVEANEGRSATDGIANRHLSEAEIKAAQIKEVFELLVKQHPNYSTFIVDGHWALAQKTQSSAKSYTLVHRNEEVFADLAVKGVRKAQAALRKLVAPKGG